MHLIADCLKSPLAGQTIFKDDKVRASLQSRGATNSDHHVSRFTWLCSRSFQTEVSESFALVTLKMHWSLKIAE
jgi:hypothetical protein